MKKESKKRVGRPREFDVEAALDAAIEIFFEQGYQAATLDDLTKAMEIERPSLYYAFGNKENLYLQALRRYRENFEIKAAEILNETGDTKQAIENLLRWMKGHLESAAMRGCLVVNTTVDCQEKNSALWETVQNMHLKTEEILFERFQKGKEDGDLPKTTDSRALAQFFNAVMQGMAVLARGQGSHEALENITVESLKVFHFQNLSNTN